MLHLKIIKIQNPTPLKLGNLNINDYLDSSIQRGTKSYELFSVCLHHGESINFGHYTSNYLEVNINKFIITFNIIIGLCKNYKDFKWRHFDDSHVSNPIADLQNYLLKTNAFPYILFYKKIDQQQINTSKFNYIKKVSYFYIN